MLPVLPPSTTGDVAPPDEYGDEEYGDEEYGEEEDSDDDDDNSDATGFDEDSVLVHNLVTEHKLSEKEPERELGKAGMTTRFTEFFIIA